MNVKEQYWKYSLVTIIVVLGTILFVEFIPFLGGILGACTIYILVRKQMLYLTEKKHLRRSFVAVILLLETILCFLIPLSLAVWLFINKLQNFNLDPTQLVKSAEHIANLIELVINMILDPVLILGPGALPELGVAGAAIATVTAQGIVMSVMIIGIFVQKKDNVLKGIRLFARIPMEYVSGICKIGIPTALQGMAYCVISMVLARMVSVFGAEAVAVQRVGGQIESISWNTADGFAAALNAFVGQNYGANKMDRVKKGYRASLWTVGIWGLIITAIFVFVPKPIARIFFHEATAIEIAVDYLIIVGLSEAFMCVELMTVGALSGLGKTHLCSVISIIFTGARIPLAILLCRTALGLNGIWCAVSSSSIVKGIIFVATFFWITRSSRILKDNSRL